MFKETFTALAIVAGLVATGAQAREGSERMQERFGQIDANGDGQITVEEMNAQTAARFAAADADGNGALSQAEMAGAIQSRRSTRLLERFDTDRDGSLSAEELSAMDGKKDGRHEARAAKYFERMDADQSGDLSPAEMQGRRDPAQMVTRLDADKNGSLSLEEFAKARGHGKHMGKDKKDRAAD